MARRGEQRLTLTVAQLHVNGCATHPLHMRRRAKQLCAALILRATSGRHPHHHVPTCAKGREVLATASAGSTVLVAINPEECRAATMARQPTRLPVGGAGVQVDTEQGSGWAGRDIA